MLLRDGKHGAGVIFPSIVKRNRNLGATSLVVPYASVLIHAQMWQFSAA